MTDLFRSTYQPEKDALAVFKHFNILYAAKLCAGTMYYVQIPAGMVNLKEIEGYVQRHYAAGLPSYTEPGSHK